MPLFFKLLTWLTYYRVSIVKDVGAKEIKTELQLLILPVKSSLSRSCILYNSLIYISLRNCNIYWSLFQTNQIVIVYWLFDQHCESNTTNSLFHLIRYLRNKSASSYQECIQQCNRLCFGNGFSQTPINFLFIWRLIQMK